MKIVNDPALYRRLSEPFESIDKATEAVNDFFADLRTLREKYGIPDTYTIVRMNVLENGKEQDRITVMHNGDSALCFPLVQEAYIRERTIALSVMNCLEVPEALVKHGTIGSMLVMSGACSTIQQAEKFISEGEVLVDDNILKADMKAPEKSFKLTFRGRSVVVPAA